jgi:hypothetical protein
MDSERVKQPKIQTRAANAARVFSVNMAIPTKFCARILAFLHLRFLASYAIIRLSEMQADEDTKTKKEELHDR